MKKKRKHLEHDAQAEVVKWLRAANVLFCAVPNGARTSMGVARRLKAEGLQKGAPDLLIFDPPQTRTGSCGVAVEMKAPDGNKPTPMQLDWQTQLAARGWVTLVCYGAAEALGELARLGYRVPG